VNSISGKGTEFHIFLPVIEEPTDLRRNETEAFVRGEERILFIDDESLQVELARKSLGNLGYQVVAFTDSIEALRQFKETPDDFDLVITDLTMPKMTGKMLAQEMHTLRPNLPIILCSGYSDSISKEKALEMGIHDCLMKPIALKDLAQIIRKVIDNGNPRT